MITSGTTGDLARRRPFSDSVSIRAHADRRTLQRCELVLRWLGKTPALDEPTRSLICTDPMVRNVVGALGMRLEAQGELGPNGAETAVQLSRALEAYHVTEHFPGGLELSHAVHFTGAGGESHGVRLWQTQSAPSPLVASFTASLTTKVPTAQAFADFTAEQTATIESALELLFATVPEVAASMLPHVQLLCRLATPPSATNVILSSSFRDISGIVFLADPLLASPLVAAEHILHEACHQRYGEFSHSASILADGYDEKFTAKLVVPWHRGSAESSIWSTDKALTAAHVYLYLTYFYGMMHDARDDRSPIEAEEVQRRLFSTYGRGRFLLTALDATGRGQLGYAGNLLLDWMVEVFKAFAVEDDAATRLTRLVLERYAEEESEFKLHATALAGHEFAADDERFNAFMGWLDTLEPATSLRFEKCFSRDHDRAASAADDSLPPGFERPACAPLARYFRARRERARTIRDVLASPPGELGRRIDHRAALTFAQAESINLDRFADPAFRDLLVRRNALRSASLAG